MSELPGLLIIGIASSLSVCSISCIGYLAPVLITEGATFRTGIQDSFLFMTGKILLYATMGGIVAWSGSRIPESAIRVTTPMTGGFLILLGLWLHFRRGDRGISCHSARHNRADDTGTYKNRSIRGGLLFFSGLLTSMIPCPSVMALLTMASRADSAILGFGYGLTYGIGLLVSPVLIAGGGLSVIAQKIRLQASEITWMIRTISSAIVIISGIKMILLVL